MENCQKIEQLPALTRLALGIEDSTRSHVVEEELDRLSPFLQGLASRQAHPLPALKDIFRLQAERSGALLDFHFSTVRESAVVEQDREDPRQNFFRKDYLSRQRIRGEIFGMGFMQAIDGYRSYSVPIIAVSDKIMDAIDPYDPEALLDSLAYLYTMGNHDYMHHIMPETAPSVIRTFRPDGIHVRRTIDRFFGPNKDNERSCESFFILSHAKSFDAAFAHNEEFHEAYTDATNTLLSEIKRISHACTDGKTANKIVNYFGMAALFAMARVMDIKHDSRAIDFNANIKNLDPMPDYFPSCKESALARLFKNIHIAMTPICLSEEENLSLRTQEVLALSPRLTHIAQSQRLPYIPHFIARLENMEDLFLAAITKDIKLDLRIA